MTVLIVNLEISNSYWHAILPCITNNFSLMQRYFIK